MAGAPVISEAFFQLFSGLFSTKKILICRHSTD